MPSIQPKNYGQQTDVETTCSGCMKDLSLNLKDGILTMHIPSNGLRGSKRVEAATLTADILFDAEDVDFYLAMWDCPTCGYADSLDLSGE